MRFTAQEHRGHAEQLGRGERETGGETVSTIDEAATLHGLLVERLALHLVFCSFFCYSCLFSDVL